MSPFRETPVKWDGDDGGGRYVNKDGYKFDIVSKSIVKKAEDMPKCFLAETPEAAQELYDRFEKTLNNYAYSYAVSTGIDKGDLFREALIGLARAHRDWDPKRSSDFKTYALYRIKDSLNECVRENSATISVPAYIKKANSNLKEIKEIFEDYSSDGYAIDWRACVLEQEIPIELEMSDAARCGQLVENLIAAAERAKVDYEKFIERIELLPQDVEYEDHKPAEVQKREIERIEAAIVVEKLKEHMDDDELAICDGIMLDKSYDQIGKELGISKGTVFNKLDALKQRILAMMEEGTL